MQVLGLAALLLGHALLAQAQNVPGALHERFSESMQDADDDHAMEQAVDRTLNNAEAPAAEVPAMATEVGDIALLGGANKAPAGTAAGAKAQTQREATAKLLAETKPKVQAKLAAKQYLKTESEADCGKRTAAASQAVTDAEKASTDCQESLDNMNIKMGEDVLTVKKANKDLAMFTEGRNTELVKMQMLLGDCDKAALSYQKLATALETVQAVVSTKFTYAVANRLLSGSMLSLPAEVKRAPAFSRIVSLVAKASNTTNKTVTLDANAPSEEKVALLKLIKSIKDAADTREQSRMANCTAKLAGVQKDIEKIGATLDALSSSIVVLQHHESIQNMKKSALTAQCTLTSSKVVTAKAAQAYVAGACKAKSAQLQSTIEVAKRDLDIIDKMAKSLKQ